MKTKHIMLTSILSFGMMAATLSPIQAKTATTGMSVSVNANTVKIKVTKPTSAGRLYAYNANEYASADKMRGISSRILSTGIDLGAIKKGKSKTISWQRYGVDGRDHLYNKYYILNGKKIVKGPIYATSVSAAYGKVGFTQKSIKGIYTEDDLNKASYASDLKANSITYNLGLQDLMYSNVNTTVPADAITFESNGKTYYFNKATVDNFDAKIKDASARGMNVIAVLIPWAQEGSLYPAEMRYNSPKSKITWGTNTSNDLGRDDYIAMVEFLANRYSQSKDQGYISTYVIGNEIDFTHYFYSTSNLNKYMEEYARSLRLSNLAVKKYASNANVAAPFTHYWAKSSGQVYKESPSPSFAPKKMLDWLAKYTNARGAYDWAIAPHPYGVINTKSNQAYYDTRTGAINNNYKTSKELTFTNFEILDEYLSTKALKYKGKQRSVYLTESGASSGNMKSATRFNEQAGTLAMAYYKVAHLKFVKSYNYYRLQDNVQEAKNSLTCGLLKPDGTKKPAYNVYKYIDTKSSNSKSKKYLKAISFYKDGKKKVSGKKLKSWKDAMPVYKTKFNWNKKWKWSNIYRK